MVTLISNYVLLKKRADLSQRTLNSLLDRLSLFLQISIDRETYPKLKWFNYIDEKTNACYDQTTNEIQLSKRNYRIKSRKFIYNKEKIEEEIEESLNTFLYCIPLADLYHELIHFIQFQYIAYIHTPFLEATNELFVCILTGTDSMEYKKEAIAFWYVLRNILKLKNVTLYNSLRNAIVKKDYMTKSLLSNKDFPPSLLITSLIRIIVGASSSLTMVQVTFSPSSKVTLPPRTSGHLGSPVNETNVYPVN